MDPDLKVSRLGAAVQQSLHEDFSEFEDVLGVVGIAKPGTANKWSGPIIGSTALTPPCLLFFR